MITVGVLKEPSFESRISLLAAEAAALIKAGMTVWIEAGAAMKAFCTDADYVTVGAVIKSRTDMINTADVLLSINYNDIGNDEFPTTDVVLVLGANDVVNPAAESDPSSPIYGMKILDVGKAKLVIVNKRTMKPGYASIQNQLFSQANTSMLFGDAKDVLQQLIAAIKAI